MIRSILFVILLLVITLQRDSFAQSKLHPADDSGKDSTLIIFKDKLLKAVEEKNMDFIIQSLDNNVQNSLGGDGGIEEFKQTWGAANPESAIWEELNDILSLGGTFIEYEGKKIYAAPYVYSIWPEEYDPYDYIALTDSSVALRADALPGAPAIASISYELVQPDYWWNGDQNWVKVSTTSGLTGFIERKKTRSPLDFRLGIQNIKGIWKIVWFLSGD